jgi:pilus assembly protein CpaE
MLAGAREFLQKPFKGDDLVAAVRRVHAFGQRRGVGAPVAQPAEDAPSASADGATPTAAPRVHTRGVVTAVISGKGGVGKTVIAINLAAALGESHPERVVLVDLSLQFGDVGAALNLPTDHSITDLLSENGTADSDTVRQALASGPAQILVLLAPTSPELADYVSVAHLTSLIETLRSEFDHVIIDTPSYLNEVSILTLELADHVVMVTDLSVTGVKNARLTRGILETLAIDASKVLVVANHREGAGELDRRGAETFLGAHIAVEIPFAADIVATSINKGIPFVISSPSAAATTALRAVVAAIEPASRTTGDPAAKPESSDKKKRPRRKLSFTR